MGRRKQNTSCDECRKARLGCNASSMRDRCSNCIRRNRNCAKEWIHRHQGERRRAARDVIDSEPGTPGTAASTPKPKLVAVVDEARNSFEQFHRQSQTSTISPFGMEQTESRRQQSSVLHSKLWDAFSRIFEPRLALWMASGCCPFGGRPTSLTTEPFMWRLVTKLDLGGGGTSTQRYEGSAGSSSDRAQDNNIISQALVNAVHAFSIRWLSLCDGSHEPSSTATGQSLEALSDSLWHQAQQTMYSIMSKPSYRSILALHLFGITPVPSKNGDSRIRDLCTEIALNQQNNFQSARHFDHPSIRSSANMGDPILPSSLQQEPILMNYERSYMQDRIYWFSVTCDTARSLTQCRPSILLPNRTGDSKVWNHVRLNIQRFDAAFQPLRNSKTPLSDGVANIVLQYTSAGQKMFCSAVVEMQDALYRNEDDNLQEAAVDNVFQQLNYFEEVFVLPLDQCAKEFMFLNEQNQISYVLVILHFHMTTLVLLDGLSNSIGICTTIWEPQHLRNGSCRAIVNATSLALQADRARPKNDPQTSLLLLDPNSETTALALSRAGSSILILYHIKLLSARVVERMFSVVLAGLEVISQICYTAGDALQSLKDSFSKLDFNVCQVSTTESSTARDATALENLELLEDKWMKKLTEQACSDPTLISKNLDQYEDLESAVFSTESMSTSGPEFSWQSWNQETLHDTLQSI